MDVVMREEHTFQLDSTFYICTQYHMQVSMHMPRPPQGGSPVSHGARSPSSWYDCGGTEAVHRDPGVVKSHCHDGVGQAVVLQQKGELYVKRDDITHTHT